MHSIKQPSNFTPSTTTIFLDHSCENMFHLNQYFLSNIFFKIVINTVNMIIKSSFCSVLIANTSYELNECINRLCS